MEIKERVLLETWCHYFRGGISGYIKSAPGGYLYLTERAVYFKDGNLVARAFTSITESKIYVPKDFFIPLDSILKVSKSIHFMWPTLRIETRSEEVYKFLLNPNNRLTAAFLPAFVAPGKTQKWVNAIKNMLS